jgi:S-DNA-T family DNA segregation ATPase FtsK/SpoIIIE
VTRTVGTPSGPTIVTPALEEIRLGPPVVLTVRLMPGTVSADIRRHAYRIAPHLGARALRVLDAGFGRVTVELLAADPLQPVLDLPDRPLSDSGVWIARTEDGLDITCRPDQLPHVIAQGRTRSGKSAWTYALLAQVAHRRDVTVAGVDAFGLLLRPFAGTHHARQQAVGLRDLARIEHVLAELVDDIDHRIATLPPLVDKLATTPADPLVIVVLEEWPAVLRTLDADANDKTRGKRVRALVGRLLAESHKAGMRTLMIAQRAESNLIGGAERDQCDGRLTFRVGSVESVKLLHPDALPDLVTGHETAPDGVCLLTWPGVPGLVRARAPWIGGYRQYCQRIAAAGPSSRGAAA